MRSGIRRRQVPRLFPQAVSLASAWVDCLASAIRVHRQTSAVGRKIYCKLKRQKFKWKRQQVDLYRLFQTKCDARNVEPAQRSASEAGAIRYCEVEGKNTKTHPAKRSANSIVRKRLAYRAPERMCERERNGADDQSAADGEDE